MPSLTLEAAYRSLKRGEPAPVYYLTGEADVLTLSPIWLPDAGIENFARPAIAHNPNIRITVQEFWLPNDTFNPIYPLETRKKVDHNAATIPARRLSRPPFLVVTEDPPDVISPYRFKPSGPPPSSIAGWAPAFFERVLRERREVSSFVVTLRRHHRTPSGRSGR